MSRALWYIVPVTFGLLLIAMTLHALPFTRQPDVQTIQYAFEILADVRDGTLAEYLAEPKKYPLPYVLAHSGVFSVAILGLFAAGELPSLSQAGVQTLLFTDPSLIHLGARLLTACSAVLLLYLLYCCTRRLFPTAHPLAGVVLMAASPLFLTLSTAMRGHVPHAAFLLLTFVASLRLMEQRSLSRAIAAFGSAGLAFVVLQNGMFAFLFPLAALGFRNGRFGVSHLWEMRSLVLVGIGIGFLSATVGYPFLWKELLVDGNVGIGFGNEDIAETPWSVAGYGVLAWTLLGSELVLVIFALLTLWQWLKGRVSLHPLLAVAAIYCALYVLVFGMVGWATPRYFLPISVFAVLFAIPSFGRMPKVVHIVVILFVALLHLQFVHLALKPDTYDVAAAYLRDHTRGVIASNVPHYHLGIPPAREGIGSPTMARERWILDQPVDLPGARVFVPFERRNEADIAVVEDSIHFPVMEEEWVLCDEVRSANKVASMFLWSEVDTALWWIGRTGRLGPTIFIYCRQPSV